MGRHQICPQGGCCQQARQTTGAGGGGLSFWEQLRCLQGNVGTAKPTAKTGKRKQEKKKGERFPPVKARNGEPRKEHNLLAGGGSRSEK